VIRERGDAEKARWDLAILYAVTVAGYALISTIPIAFELESRVVTVPYRAAVLALSVWSILRSFAKNELYQGALWIPLGIFWTLYLGRMLADTFVFPVELGQPAAEYFLYGIGTTFIPMVAMFARPSEATLRAALRLTVLTSFVALAAVLYLGAKAVLSGELMAIGRFELRTLNPISLGHVGVSLTTLALFTLLLPERRSWLSVLTLVAASGIGLECTLITASKGPLLALLLNVACLLVLDWRRGHQKRALVGAVIAPLLGSQLAIYFEDRLGFGVISRFQEALDDPTVASVSERVDVQRRAWEQFLSHPVLGSSLEERVSLFYPHNTIVESFMAVGVVGGVAYLAYHAFGLLRALRLIASRTEAAWVGILCLQYTLSAMFSGSLYGNGAMWAFLSAGIAICERRPSIQVAEAETQSAAASVHTARFDLS
jgi:hypothetical protein